MCDLDVFVFGGGVVGLMCVIEVVKWGWLVFVFDYVKWFVEKICIFGGGCCNFINLYCFLVNFLF